MFRTVIPCLVFATVSALAAGMKTAQGHQIAVAMGVGATLFMLASFYMARQENYLRDIKGAIRAASTQRELDRLLRLGLDAAQHINEVGYVFDATIVVIVVILFVLMM